MVLENWGDGVVDVANGWAQREDYGDRARFRSCHVGQRGATCYLGSEGEGMEGAGPRCSVSFRRKDWYEERQRRGDQV